MDKNKTASGDPSVPETPRSAVPWVGAPWQQNWEKGPSVSTEELAATLARLGISSGEAQEWASEYSEPGSAPPAAERPESVVSPAAKQAEKAGVSRSAPASGKPRAGSENAALVLARAEREFPEPAAKPVQATSSVASDSTLAAATVERPAAAPPPAPDFRVETKPPPAVRVTDAALASIVEVRQVIKPEFPASAFVALIPSGVIGLLVIALAIGGAVLAREMVFGGMPSPFGGGIPQAAPNPFGRPNPFGPQ